MRPRPFAQRAGTAAIRAAIDDVLAGKEGGMFEGTADMPVEQADAFATRYAYDRVKLTIRGPWLHVDPPDE